MGTTTFATYSMVTSCSTQYADLQDSTSPDYNWYQNFNFLADLHPIVENNYTDLQTAAAAVQMAFDAYGIYAAGKTMYWYFFAGRSIGLLLSNIFVSADAWAGSNIITPTDPWILYNAQA